MTTVTKTLGVCLLATLLTAHSVKAQQAAGDKEIGIGGSIFASHSKPFNGNAFGQLSFGSYLSRNNFVGIEVMPIVSIANKNTDVSGVFGAKVRHFFGGENKRAYPFVGAGVGTYGSAGGSGKNFNVSGSFETGVKNYFSPKTSLDLSYQMLYVQSGGGSFAQKSFSNIMLSIRHLF